MRIDSSYSLFNNSNSITSYDFYSSLVNYSASSTQSVDNFSLDTSDMFNTPTLNTDYLGEFESQLSNLSQQAEALITEEASSVLNTVDEEDSVFQERTVSSSDTTVLTASVNNGAEINEYDIQVDQIAQEQINESASFDSDISNDFTIGDNTLEISQGNQSQELTVDVFSSDSNSDVLNKLSEEINNSSLDLNAEVISNDDGTEQLEVEATTTGTNDSFSISDLSGDLAAQTNLNNAIQTAQDAQYEIDGESLVSATNQVEVNNSGVSLNLFSPGSTDVTVDANNETITTTMQSFVEEFNETVRLIQDNIQQTSSLDLAGDLIGITERAEGELESIGIESNLDGTLNLNEDEFKQSLEDNFDGVKETLGSITGVASEVNEEVENTLSGPISDYSEMSQFSIYNQSGQSIFPFTSIYSGSLFDSYF